MLTLTFECYGNKVFLCFYCSYYYYSFVIDYYFLCVFFKLILIVSVEIVNVLYLTLKKYKKVIVINYSFAKQL